MAKSMNNSKMLGLQAARLALGEIRERTEDAYVGDRLDRVETVLSRIVAELASTDADEENTASSLDKEAGRIERREARVASLTPQNGNVDQTESVDLAGALQAYVKRRFPEETDLRIVSAKRLPGGRSKQTLIVETEGGRKWPARLVLRTDSSRTTEYDSVAREYPLIAAVHEHGSPAPEPLWFEPDPSVIGAAFIAFSHVGGSPAGNLWGAYDDSDAAARALAETLAQLHSLPTAIVDEGAPRDAATAVRELFESYERRWRAAWPGPSMAIEKAFDWLQRRVPELEGPAVIVHGDAHFSNVLMDGDRLTALLDWEFWHFGHPAEDLAYCRPYVEHVLEWEEFVGLYVEAGGDEPVVEVLDTFAIWRPLRNAVLGANIAHDFVAKEDLDLDTAAIALSTYPRMEAQLMKALWDASRDEQS
jgi:aminoglycoside phosphotransferase (APT) family kinase protein